MTRNGGIVGFSDTVVVRADGVTTVGNRRSGSSRCRLDRGLLTSLTVAVEAVDWAAVGAAEPTVRHPDDLIIAVSAAGGTTRLEDPAVKPLVEPVGRLLAAATAPAANRRLCRPL